MKLKLTFILLFFAIDGFSQTEKTELDFIKSGIQLCNDEPTGNCALGDIDNDGDIDIFNTFFGDGSNSVYFNQIIK